MRRAPAFHARIVPARSIATMEYSEELSNIELRNVTCWSIPISLRPREPLPPRAGSFISSASRIVTWVGNLCLLLAPLWFGAPAGGNCLPDRRGDAGPRDGSRVVRHQLPGQRGGEIRGRLVQDQHARLQHQDAADGEHLAFPAAELLGAPPEQAAQHRKHGADRLDAPGNGGAREEVGAHLEIFGRGERLEDIADLRDIPDTAPGQRFGGEVPDVVFPEPHAHPRYP